MNPTDVFQRKGVLFYALSLACFGIWGYVLLQVVRSVSAEDGSAETVVGAVAFDPSPAPSRSNPDFMYRADFPDPFALPLEVLSKAAAAPPRSDKPPLPALPPPLTLGGVVDGTALLQGQDGSTFIARAGEQAGVTRILKVENDHAVVRYKGGTFTLRLVQ